MSERTVGVAEPSALAVDYHDPDCHEPDANGVDLTLVRYTLSLSPTERLKAVENFMNAMATVRRRAPAK